MSNTSHTAISPRGPWKRTAAGRRCRGIRRSTMRTTRPIGGPARLAARPAAPIWSSIRRRPQSPGTPAATVLVRAASRAFVGAIGRSRQRRRTISRVAKRRRDRHDDGRLVRRYASGAEHGLHLPDRGREPDERPQFGQRRDAARIFTINNLARTDATHLRVTFSEAVDGRIGAERGQLHRQRRRRSCRRPWKPAARRCCWRRRPRFLTARATAWSPTTSSARPPEPAR